MAYVTVAQARARISGLDDFSDATITAAIAEFEDIAERYCGRTFTSRSVTETVGVRPLPSTVVLKHAEVTALSAISHKGNSVATTNVDWTPGGVVRNIPWPTWDGAATITYTYGASSTPDAIKRACIDYVARTLRSEDSGTGPDVSRTGFADGGFTQFIQPDWSNGKPTGWRDVDRVLNSYRQPLGFA